MRMLRCSVGAVPGSMLVSVEYKWASPWVVLYYPKPHVQPHSTNHRSSVMSPLQHLSTDSKEGYQPPELGGRRRPRLGLGFSYSASHSPITCKTASL
jgi:hypothetical protein